MKLFLLGGFLGSGKTTAIQQAVPVLQQQGKKVGVVMNDQGDELVDALFMQQQAVPVEAVTGSCFCCNYNQFAACIESLQEKDAPDYILAESVGSCTDLVATIIKPLQQYNAGKIKPVLSVFADVRLLYAYLFNDKDLFNGSMNYVYQKQLEEADIIVVNKMDLVKNGEEKNVINVIKKAYPEKKILFQQSLLKHDIEKWINTALAFTSKKRTSLTIDYDIYAAGEAEMSWYDSTVEIITDNRKADKFGLQLIYKIHEHFKAKGYLIGHLKFFIHSKKHHKKISFTTLPVNNDADKISLNWRTNKIAITINARIKTSPETAKSLIQKAIKEIKLNNCIITEKNIKAFRPGYPKPTHRIMK